MSNGDLSPQETKFMATGCCCCCSLLFVCSAISGAFAAAAKFFDSLNHFFQNNTSFIIAIIAVFSLSLILIITVLNCCHAWKFHGYPAPSLPQLRQIAGRNQQQPTITNNYNILIINDAMPEQNNLLNLPAIKHLPNQHLRIEEVREV